MMKTSLEVFFSLLVAFIAFKSCLQPLKMIKTSMTDDDDDQWLSKNHHHWIRFLFFGKKSSQFFFVCKSIRYNIGYRRKQNKKNGQWNIGLLSSSSLVLSFGLSRNWQTIDLSNYRSNGKRENLFFISWPPFFCCCCCWPVLYHTAWFVFLSLSLSISYPIFYLYRFWPMSLSLFWCVCVAKITLAYGERDCIEKRYFS